MVTVGIAIFPPLCKQEENLNLRLKLNVGDEAEDEENSEISEIKNRLDHMISSGVAEGQISQTMDILKDRFADYGRCDGRGCRLTALLPLCDGQLMSVDGAVNA